MPAAPQQTSNSGPDWFGHTMALFALLAVAAQLVWPPSVELMQRDSPGYLAFDPARTVGYPLFLRLIEQLPGGLQWVPSLQLGSYGLAALILAKSFRRLSGSAIVSGLLLVLLLGNLQVTRLAFMIMTEPLFLVCLMLELALFCRLLQSPRWQILALSSLAAALGVLIRPAGYAMVLALPLMAWWSWRDGLPGGRAVLAAALPYLAVLGFSIALYHAEHGQWRSQNYLANSNLFGKAIAIVDPTRLIKDRDIIQMMATTVAPDRAVIDHAPNLLDRYLILTAYYDVWHFRTLIEPLAARTHIPSTDTAALQQMMLGLSLEIIAAQPLAYLGDVALSYAALWWLPDAMTHAQLEQFNAFLAALGPLPDIDQYPDWHHEHSDVLIVLLHSFMMIALLSTLWWGWLLAASVFQHKPLTSVARLGIASALVVHATFILTALLQAGIPRYVWAMWPALCVLVVSILIRPLRSGPCSAMLLPMNPDVGQRHKR